MAVVLIADVTGATDAAVTLAPLAYLKGATSGAAILLTRREDGCEQASFAKGSRVMVALESLDGSLVWPGPNQVFAIDPALEFDQQSIVIRVRDVTSQLTFPAQTAAAGAGMDWGRVILPVGGAIAVIFIISFVMMIYWHRIDPS